MKKILFLIVLSQFLCTSLWFAGNAVLHDIMLLHQLDSSYLAHFTSAVQFGFIIGTLLFAIFSIADRYSPSLVFFSCALCAASLNLIMSLENSTVAILISCRFLTGFFLAGIYPVGMKIASDYEQKGLGKSLGFLVGALVLGTAFPHALKGIGVDFPWKYVIYFTSYLAVLGGILIFLFVKDGPFRKKSQQIDLKVFFTVFKNSEFRSVSFGYFGHMWELYTFWAFVPVILTYYKNQNPNFQFDVSSLSFLIIAIGSLACVTSGYLSLSYKPKLIATLFLALSCICCLVSPFIINTENEFIFLVFIFCWSFFVIADSPLFSTLVAQTATTETRGTSLTIVNCIGFSITIISIQVLTYLSTTIHFEILFIFLAIGPILGLFSLLKKPKTFN